jgi:hypothetical protein
LFTGLVVFGVVSVASLTSPIRLCAQGTNLQYLGGPIMGDPTVYTIFWLPPGRHFEQDPSRDTAYEAFINGFMHDLDGSPYFKILVQYSSDPKGSPIPGGPITGHVTLGGSWVDTGPYPHAGTSNDPVLASDLRPAIERAMAENGWTPGLHKVFLVYLAAHINYCTTSDGVCADAGLGGSHYAFTAGDSPLLAMVVPDGYSFSQDSGRALSSGSATADGDPYTAMVAPASVHELVETVTDPMVGYKGLAALDPAWRRERAFGAEIADACQSYETDLTVGTHTYPVPALYSNATHACVFSSPALPLRLKLATKRVRKGKTQTLTIATGAGARLVVHIEPGGRVVRARAGASGKYTYRWRALRASHTYITVTAATDDGQAGLSLAQFGVR